MRYKKVRPDHPELSINQSGKLLSIVRLSYFDAPKGVTEQNVST
jgi:hypothetical protein